MHFNNLLELRNYDEGHDAVGWWFLQGQARHWLNAIHHLPLSSSLGSQCLIGVEGSANLSMPNKYFFALTASAEIQEHGSIHFGKQIRYTHQVAGSLIDSAMRSRCDLQTQIGYRKGKCTKSCTWSKSGCWARYSCSLEEQPSLVCHRSINWDRVISSCLHPSAR